MLRLPSIGRAFILAPLLAATLTPANVHADSEDIELVSSHGLLYEIQNGGVGTSTSTWTHSSSVFTSTTTWSGEDGVIEEASFVRALEATTVNGGTVTMSLGDAFDGYGELRVQFEDGFAESPRGGEWIWYMSGLSSMPNTACMAGVGESETAREHLFAPQRIDDRLEVSRRVFVPEDDTFVRQLDLFTNVDTAPLTFRIGVTNNLGSDGSTLVLVTSSGGAGAITLTDGWATSMQDWSGSESGDPRLAHVFGYEGVPSGAIFAQFEDGDGDMDYVYEWTLAPGETRALVRFVSGHASKAEALATAQRLADPRTVPAAFRCLETEILAQIVNMPTRACSLASDVGDACDDGDAETLGDVCTAERVCAGQRSDDEPDAGTGTDAGTGSGSGKSSGCAASAAQDSGVTFLGLIGLAALLRRVRRTRR